MADNKKSVNLLPEFLRTEKNSKFLHSTVDQFNQTPQIERIDGYVGSKVTPNYKPDLDFYLKEAISLRSNYQLNPAAVFKDSQSNITDVVAFDDLVNEIGIQYRNNKNFDNLFRSNVYSYDPLIDWDKLVNFNNYYWLVNGPDLIKINADGINVSTDILGQAVFMMPNGHYLSNGMKISFTDDVQPVFYKNKDFIVEGVGSSIKLIDFSLLDSFDRPNRVFDERFDGVKFDDYPFDGDRKLPIDPEYITINRASRDLNPWSRYNRWFHKDVISISAKINNKIFDFNFKLKAARPIIEFLPNLQLQNFGRKGIRHIDLIDNDTQNIFEVVDGSYGYYVDGKLIQDGNRIIFNAAADSSVRGKIYIADYTNVNGSRILTLVPAEDHIPEDLDSTSVDYGDVYSGSSWYYVSSENKWYKSQERLRLNQAPLFDLFNDQNENYSLIKNSSFQGNKIFGYDIGISNKNDPVLNFPLNTNSGRYLFKNYFMTDEFFVTSNNVTKKIFTSGCLIKKYKDDNSFELINVWRPVQEHRIPIIEFQVPVENTSSLKIKSLDSPSASQVRAYVNDKLTKTTTSIDDSNLVVNFFNDSGLIPKQLTTKDRVLFKIYTDQVPNSNGYYDTPLSLTNNPLNSGIFDMTLSELTDHFNTMIDNYIFSSGNNIDKNNIRDVGVPYKSFGTRLVINETPIVFSQIFLGKKEHNLVDAVRFSAERYGQFKMNFLRALVNINDRNPVYESLDNILMDINKSKNLKSSFYRSDMLGYGKDKQIKIFKVDDPDITEYSINFEYDSQSLSFKSVLIYLNSEQLILEKDYTFNNVDNTIQILRNLEINDEISVHCYSDTLGSFVPPTPTKLGLYPKFEPLKYEDNSYLEGPVNFIRGHDGSLIRAYNDYRDDIILEFEKRVFNNIKVNYNPELYNIFSIIPGAFRNTNYSLNDFNDLIIKDFIKWAGSFNVDVYSNFIYEENNPLTWNYLGSNDRLFDQPTRGTWRSLYRYFFDTDRPHTHPWEMLGHHKKPQWWDNHYSWTNSGKRTALISSLVSGRTQEPPSNYTDSNYARPGFSNIVPVDTSGNLLSPDEFLVTPNGYADKISNWIFGDIGPSEHSWRNSSYWPFVLVSAAALLDPCGYLTRMYDISRTEFNIVDQLIYNNGLYLSPSKLVIEGENEQQISGYGNYIIERGIQKIEDYQSTLRRDLDYLNCNLFYKLGGFTGKDKLQIVIDSVNSDSNSSGEILPPEDFTLILNVSNPIKSVSISGIIVQKSNGKFLIKGYDKNNPYFEIFKPIKTPSSGALTVGGVSSPFVEWKSSASLAITGNGNSSFVGSVSQTSNYYKVGQIVRYNGRYYRVKIGHNVQASFDINLFQLLPSLPMTGGATVQLPSKFESLSTRIPYGSEFTTIQDVYDFIIGYGAWLESQGFIFDSYNEDLNDIIDWKFTGKEFMFWTTQNWTDNSIIALSPFAEYLKYQYTNSIVDDISTGKYEYSLLKADGRSYPVDKFSLAREDGYCVIKSVDTEEGLFFATLNLIQKEHAIVLNNTTIFNDIVYDLETGYRQKRIKLSGFRTKNWNGDLFSPGFVYDEVIINDWKPYQIYLPGKVVRYNGSYYESNKKINGDDIFDFAKWTKLSKKPSSQLLPNFDYKINQFDDFYSLDIDNFDLGQQVLAQHLIGYTPRTYLNNIFTNSISQYKFYQGFIREKGTRNAINKLSKVILYNQQGEIDIVEEWAFRVGEYGSFDTYKEIEVSLLEGSYLENPYLIKFVDKIPSDKQSLTHYVLSRELISRPENYQPSKTFVISSGTFTENNIELIVAGYPRIDDVSATAYNKNSLLDIANNSDLKEGDTIWTGFLENGDWTVYRYSRQNSKIESVSIDSSNNSLIFKTDFHHDLKVGDIISIVRFNDQVNGVYIVSSVPELGEFTVSSNISSLLDNEALDYGLLYKFSPVRFRNFKDLIKVDNFINFNEGEKIWIDEGVENKWEVYQKYRNYFCSSTSTSVNLPGSPFGQQLGANIYSSETAPVVLVASPGWKDKNSPSRGKVLIYEKSSSGQIIKRSEYFLNSKQKIYCDPDAETDFGHSIIYDEGKDLYIVGAPSASDIRAPLSFGQILTTTGTSFSRSGNNEGIVKITKFSSSADPIDIVLVNPYVPNADSGENSRFGNSIYINQVGEEDSTLMLIGAPGNSLYNGPGTVYAYVIDSQGNVSAHPNGLILNSRLPLENGDQWGYKISGDLSGNIIAIGAPNLAVDGKFGLIQIFGRNLTVRQTLINPFDNEGRFGDKICISKTGKYLFASSILTKGDFQSYGKVAVYSLNILGDYVLTQVLDNPVSDVDLQFGYSISISDDEKTLTIGALGINKSKILDFDSSNTGETLFNEDTTKFISKVNGAGQVFVYTNLRDSFILADVLDNVDIPKDSRYGYSVSLTNDDIFVGAPSSVSSNIVEVIIDNKSPIVVSNHDTVSVVFDSLPDLPHGVKPVAEVQFSELSTSTKVINKINLVVQGSGYLTTPGASLLITTDCETRTESLTVRLKTDESRFYHFRKIDKKINSWNLLRTQPDLVDVSAIKRVALVDSLKEEIIDYLDIIDPVKGKISGLAEQELTYKSPIDPAVYSIGLAGTVNDTETNWLDDHIGELWWDLSTAKYMWYEQGDDLFRKNNWGRLFPGANIDVYEWIKSDLLPSEWASQADTNLGLTKGISGQPKYPDNSVISVKQVFNNITGSFENVYYYWVKNKLTTPNIKNRRISSYQVASIISDPVANGLKFVEILSSDSVAFANVQPILSGNKINVNIASDEINNSIPRHTEWEIIPEGNTDTVLNPKLETKLIDSLLGRDSQGNLVPDPNLSYRNRYGIEFRPRQSMFKNRTEALRNLFTFVNEILIKNKITGNYNFDNLNNQETIPGILSREYDEIVDSIEELNEIDVSKFRRAIIECDPLVNEKIVSVRIIEPGYGYLQPPKVLIKSEEEIEILTSIDSEGKVVSAVVSNSGQRLLNTPILEVRPYTVIVSANSEYGNKWTKHEFNYDYTADFDKWVRIKTQTHNTTAYWKYVDWKIDNFNQYKDIDFYVSNLFDLKLLDEVPLKSYIKVQNIGDGRSAILEKIENDVIDNFIPSYNIVFSYNGTIQLLDTLWDYDKANYAYDDASLEETFYDQIPDLEIYYIIKALQQDIFIRDLKINWNLFFFKAIRYALTEQRILDWCFKTSFISIFNKKGSLIQRPTFKIDDEQYIEKYIREVKPYHSQIRKYSLDYTTSTSADLSITDFDLPSYFNEDTNKFETVKLTDSEINQEPWKFWKENYKSSIGNIEIGYRGKGYTEKPIVNITTATGDSGTGATAEAYIRNGEIYQVVVTNPGSGYVVPPVVSITGGGANVTTATATAKIQNSVIRKNSIGIKFDRITTAPEIFNEYVIESFICDGKTNKFDLKWLADDNRSLITPLVDGKLVFAADYELVTTSRKINGVTQKYNFIKLLKIVPAQGQEFKIRYRKSLSIYSAADRLSKYYSPSEIQPGLNYPMLMSGAEYPYTVIQGLPFDYSVPWDNNFSSYDKSAWGDLTINYTKSKIINTSTIGSDLLFLDDVSKVQPGQIINILSTSTKLLRNNTTVNAVYPDINAIALPNLIYNIRSVKALGTSTGSTIIIKTKTRFYNSINSGDNIFVFGVVANEFNGYYTVNKVTDNNTFEISSLGSLTTTTTTIYPSGAIKLANIIQRIEPASILLEKTIKTVTGSSATLLTDSKIDDISKSIIQVNGVRVFQNTTSTAYYNLIEHPEISGRALLQVYNLPGGFKSISTELYSDPVVEFWTNNTDFNSLDTSLSGGSWNSQGAFLGAAGVSPEEVLVDGHKFLSIDSGYSPEELIKGQVIDSLGLNVYTKEPQNYVVATSGAFVGKANQPTENIISVDYDSSMAIIVYSDEKIFNRRVDLDFEFDNEYFISGNIITVAPQPVNRRIGFSVVGTSSGDYVDLGRELIQDRNEVLVQSLSSFNDIRAVYVLVDGEEISEITTTTNYGYLLDSVSPTNNRACVKVYNLPPGANVVEAWFFTNPYSKITRITEEAFVVNSLSQTTFELSKPPSTIEPSSAKVLVEIIYNSPTAQRKRLLPPWISYYQVDNNQTTFDIDSKNSRPPGTYTLPIVKVYVNGISLRPGFDYTVNSAQNTVTISNGILKNNDVVAVMGLIDYDYYVSGNLLYLNTGGLEVELGNDTFIRVISFNDADRLMLRTERFAGNVAGRFVLSRPVPNDNYIWITVNGIPLIARYDYEILEDLKTVQLSEWIDVEMNDDILISTLNVNLEREPNIGFRIFKDMFERHSYKRLSKENSTFLTKELYITDDEIHVNDASVLSVPDISRNVPGAIIIDGERIEFFVKEGNVLKQLRRGTLGTAAPLYSEIRTTVTDQSSRQNVPYRDRILTQKILSNFTTTYTISTVSNFLIGDGVVLNPNLPAKDQIFVYYGGRMLRKMPLKVQSPEELDEIHEFPPEFTVDSLTNKLILNIAEPINSGTMIAIVQKLGTIWSGTESLVTSDAIEARFLRNGGTDLPDNYYYGGDPVLRENNNFEITDDDNDPLEEGF